MNVVEVFTKLQRGMVEHPYQPCEKKVLCIVWSVYVKPDAKLDLETNVVTVSKSSVCNQCRQYYSYQSTLNNGKHCDRMLTTVPTEFSPLSRSFEPL